MKKKIIITATFAACLALCAAVWPQAETVKETPLPSEMTAVTALQPTLQNTEEWVVPVTTEKKRPKLSLPRKEPSRSCLYPPQKQKSNPKRSRNLCHPRSQNQIPHWCRPHNRNMSRYQRWSQKPAITARRIRSMSPASAG